MENIKFVDLETQQQRINAPIKAAIDKVLAHGDYIFGPEVNELERQLEEFWQIKHCLACSNGTDALRLALMNENIGPGDTVIAPAFTYIATLEAAKILGAEIFFCDVSPKNYIITPETLNQAIENAQTHKRNVKAVITTDLFGMPVDYTNIKNICEHNNLLFISDSAQAFGAFRNRKSAAQIADYASVSFFPAKVLGCYGDGGALFYDHRKPDKKLRAIAFHGHQNGNTHLHLGDNIRIGTLQAAILLQKLKIFTAELKTRNHIAQRYHDALHNLCKTPHIAENTQPVWAQYAITTPKRDALQTYLQQQNIPTRIYYNPAAHRQPPYKHCPATKLTHTETLEKTILNLPIHPYLTAEQQDHIIAHIRKFLS